MRGIHQHLLPNIRWHQHFFLRIDGLRGLHQFVWYTIWRLLCGMLRLHKTKFHATAVSDYNADIHAHSDADD
ncbi:hypothetical protein KC333_g1927 [Hortaea werneckii]|nr:hypothetical protein KC333_g1927 [Hortaea werneckii]